MTQTYIKNPDGTFSPAPSPINPIIEAAKTFAAAAATETTPATLHAALTNIGSQIPSSVPVAAMAAVAMSPDVQNSIVNVGLSALSGNWVSALGLLFGAAITGYATFTKTQLQGITNAQIDQYTSSLSRDQLIASLSKSDASNAPADANSAANAGSPGATSGSAS